MTQNELNYSVVAALLRRPVRVRHARPPVARRTAELRSRCPGGPGIATACRPAAEPQAVVAHVRRRAAYGSQIHRFMRRIWSRAAILDPKLSQFWVKKKHVSDVAGFLVAKCLFLSPCGRGFFLFILEEGSSLKIEEGTLLSGRRAANEYFKKLILNFKI